MADYGVKISKPGYSTTDTDNHLIFNSGYPLLKVFAHGSGSFSVTSGSATLTINTHNLGYKPMFYVWTEYVDINTGNVVSRQRLCSFRDYYGLGIWNRYHAYTDTASLFLDINTAYVATVSLNYHWVIYYDGIS